MTGVLVDQTIGFHQSRQLQPWQLLACAVLHRAVLDATTAQPSTGARAQAAGWFRSGDCHWWCGVAGLDPALVASRAAALVRIGAA